MTAYTRVRRCYIFPILAFVLTAPQTFGQWQRVTGLPSTFYNEVYFISPSTGWITSQGATVLRTTNGGTTWQSSTLPGASISANRDICFISASVGIISGSDSVWKTTNGGATWTAIGPPGQRPGSAVAWFRDASNGVVGVGDCLDSNVTFYRTADGGGTWDSVLYTLSPGNAVGGIAYMNGSYVVSGEGGKLWKSTDDGANWSYSTTGSNGWQEDIIAANGSLYIASANGTACGTAGGGVVLRSSNMGSTWSTSTFATIIMWGVSMYSATDGWACGDNGKAFRTADGGATWIELSCGMTSFDAVDDICFVDSVNGWAVGTSIYRYAGDSARVSPDTLNFGDVIIQSWKDSSALLKSLGGATTVNARVITGMDASSFIGTGGLGLQVIPSCLQLPTALRFAPATEGIKRAVLEYRIAGTATPAKVVLIGRGVRPRIYADSTKRFDTILCVDRVVDSIPVENRGTAPLRITNITFSGASPNAFGYNGTLPVVIPPGITYYLVFRSVAIGSGPLTATATIATNEPDAARSPWRIHLAGFRQGVSFEFNRPNPVVIAGTAPAQICLTYRNSGNGPQQIASIIPLTNDSTIRVILPLGPTTIPAGDSTVICFQATATDTSLHQRKFRIRTMPCSVDTVVTVIYRTAAPVIAGPELLVLRSQCGSDKLDSFAVSNAGTAPLVLGAPVLSGVDKGEFSFVKTIADPDTLAPGDSRTLIVRFRPADQQRFTQRTADLTIPANDVLRPGGSLRITLTGTITIARVLTSTDTIHVGELCLGEWSPTFTLPVYNDGTASAVALILSPDTAIHSFKGHLPERPIMAKAVDTIRLEVHPNRVGPLVMPMTIRAGPCNLVDTVIVVGTVVDARIWQPTTLAMGLVRLGSTATAVVTVQNTGTTSFTVDQLTLEPGGTPFTIMSPVPPIIVPPNNGSIDVTVALSPPDTGSFSARLITRVGGRCTTHDTTLITAVGTRASVVPVRGSINMGTLSPCDANEVRRDTVRLENAGDVAVELQSIRLASGQFFAIESSPSTPVPILPGDAAIIAIVTTPELVGDGRDSLICEMAQSSIPRIAIPITASRHAAAAAIRDEAGSTLTAIDFGTLLPCRQDTFMVFHIANIGDVADSFVLRLSGPAYHIVTPTVVHLEPGETAQAVLAARAIDVDRQGELVLTSTLCDHEWRFPIVSALVNLSMDVRGLPAVPLRAGVPATLFAIAVSNADIPLTVADITVVDAAGEFAIATPYTGQSIAIGESLRIELAGTPIITGPRVVRLNIMCDGGCPVVDSVDISFEVIAPVERPSVNFSAGMSVARWGTVASIPISVTNPDQAVLDSTVLHVDVNPTLLDVRSVRLAGELQKRWSVTIVQESSSLGSITAMLKSTVTGSRLPTLDTAIIVDALVLRGPSVESPVGLWADSVYGDTRVTTDSGRFVLADYCDAHGRRLTTTGHIALEQNTPNPFNPTTEIVFETPFNGHVILDIYNDYGRLVHRLVDEVLPAGRRRVTFDATDLPSGVYMCRMSVGLQRMVRQMTLVR